MLIKLKFQIVAKDEIHHDFICEVKDVIHQKIYCC
jgi:hypothetical protein